jgi:SH3 domain
MGSIGQSHSREQLPAMTFSDDGPPYSEDEDLHSPVVTTSRHKKNKSSTNDRGRSPGASNGNRGLFVGVNGDGSEAYYVSEEYKLDQDADGPGGEIISYPPDHARQVLLSPDSHRSGQQRDSHFATSLRRPAEADARLRASESDDDCSEADDDARFSRNYSFTIASPDEEMHGKAVALFDFESEHENELPLAEGQIILVSYRHGQGWLVAQDPKTGESGLVPEEFVRLVRDIEGGLNGLTAQMDDLLSPASENAATPTVSGGGFGSHEKKASNGSNVATGEKHPSMQSSFSTSSKDLEKYPLQKEKDDNSTPTLPSHPLRNELVDDPNT